MMPVILHLCRTCVDAFANVKDRHGREVKMLGLKDCYPANHCWMMLLLRTSELRRPDAMSIKSKDVGLQPLWPSLFWLLLLQESAPFLRVLGSYPMELELGSLDSNKAFEAIT